MGGSVDDGEDGEDGRAAMRGRLAAADHQRWSNRYFADLGLMSLAAAWESESISLRKAATY